MNKVETVTPQFPDFGALLESVKENGRRIDERDERFRKEQAEREARWEAERTEFRERMDQISSDTNKAIQDMKNVFTTQWGRLVEALSRPAVLALFKKEGLEIDRVFEDVHKIKKDGQDVMEIDFALCDTSTVVIVEVKSHCDSRDIKHFLSQMEHCKEWYPDFADKELRVAVAAISYAPGAEVYAQKQGVYVLKLTGEETFTMIAPENPKTF